MLLGLGCAAATCWGLGCGVVSPEGLGGSPGSWGATAGGIDLCWCVGAPLDLWGELWVWGGLVLSIGEREVSPVLLGLGACLSGLGLWSSPWGEQAVVGVARQAEAVCVRAGIGGCSAHSEIWTIFNCYNLL